jgi:hypothetical protein
VKTTRTGIAIFLMLAIAFAVAVFQPMGLSPDYSNYEIFFQRVRRDFTFASGYRFEPGFGYAVGWLTRIFRSDLAVYGLLVVAALIVKLRYLRAFGTRDSASGRYFLYAACVLYFCKYFPLHELTQLRVSLAVAALLAGSFYLWRSQWIVGTMAAALATSFHYSSLMLAPFLYFPRMTRRQAVILAVVIFAVLHFASVLAVSVAEQYFVVFSSYDTDFDENIINPLSLVFVPEYFMLAMALRYWDDLTEIMRRVVVVELIGFGLLFGLIDFPVLAVRGREFFSVLWVVFVVQAAPRTYGLKVAIHVFIAASIALALYQYVVLDFFSR